VVGYRRIGLHLDNGRSLRQRYDPLRSTSSSPRDLVTGSTEDVEIVGLLDEARTFHPRNNTFPGEASCA
jgi:hypothetical protein